MQDNVATVHHCLTSSVAVEARVSPWSEPGDSKDGFRVNRPSTKWIQLGIFEVHFFFGNKVQPLRFRSLMEGNATRAVVEQWLNPLHSPWVQMKPSIEKFKLKILFNTNLMPNLPTMYIYIL